MSDVGGTGTRGASPGAAFLLVDDPLFLEHRARGYHPERPERLLAAKHAVDVVAARGVAFEKLAPRDATPDEITRVHTREYLDELETTEGLYAALDDDTYLGPKSVPAAVRAAGGTVAMVEGLLDGKGPTRGLALVRPPGHHARPGSGMGFCLLNNIAIAAHAALARGVTRVAIVDWDVHHGNGTQETFYEDPRVLFTSLHQYPFYPGTGAASETGKGDGEGFTVNVPLSQNAGDPAYHEAFRRVVLPVLESYAPELILISAGFDAHVRDPLAAMILTPEAYRSMAEGVSEVAARSARGRVGVVLEGGYDLGGLSDSLIATLEGLAGLEPSPRPLQPAADPHSPLLDRAPLSQRHGLEIERARKSASAVWKI